MTFVSRPLGKLEDRENPERTSRSGAKRDETAGQAQGKRGRRKNFLQKSGAGRHGIAENVLPLFRSLHGLQHTNNKKASAVLSYK